MRSLPPADRAIQLRRAARACRSAACALALLATPWLVAPASAQGQPSPRGHAEAGGERRGPPAEAMAACQSLAAGAACKFKDQGRDLTGSCWAPQGKPLACKPSGTPGPAGAGASAPRR